MEASSIRQKIRLLKNPISCPSLLSYAISAFMFSFISVLVLDPFGKRTIIILAFFAILFGLAIWERWSSKITDHNFNSPVFQAALVLTGAISLGFVLGIDLESMNKNTGLYFSAVTFFLMASSIASIVDSIKSDHPYDLNDRSPEAIKSNKEISRERSWTFVVLMISYIVIPSIAFFFIGLCLSDKIN